MDRPARATYADLMQVPEHLVAEIIDGELVATPRLPIRHARACTVLVQALAPLDDDVPGGWWTLRAPELQLGDDVLVPDVAGWRRERMPALPDAPAVTLAPDWVCEIVSPATARLDRTAKMRAYARAGVAHVWLLEPACRTLEGYGLERGRWVLLATHAGDDVAQAEPFMAVPFALGRYWMEEAA
jgi:Uma2 family endonuclease